MRKFRVLLSISLFWGVILMAFNACSSEELDSTSFSNEAEVTTRSMAQIEDICNLSKSEFELVAQNMKDTLACSNNKLSKRESEELEEALSLYSRTDIEAVLEHYGIDKRIYEACLFYSDNIGKEDVFNLLIEKYTDFDYNDWKLAFDMYHCGMLINGMVSTRAMSTGCAMSIGGSVLSCMGACLIGNMAGFAFWMVEYSYSLVQLVYSCTH